MHLAKSSNSNKKTTNKHWVVLICNQISIVHLMEVAMFMFVIFVMILLGLVFVAEIKRLVFAFRSIKYLVLLVMMVMMMSVSGMKIL